MIDTSKKYNKEAFGKDIFYLGQEEDGTNVWLEDFTWDCGWYWGGGYLETYTNNANPEAARDISSHSHFDGLGKDKNLFDGFKSRIVKTPLTDNELWQLCDLMQSFYTLRESAEWFKNGSSHYTSIKGSTPRPEMQTLCNSIIENEIAPKVRELVTPKN